MSRLQTLLSASVLKVSTAKCITNQDRYAEICQHYLDILILYFLPEE